MVVLSPNADGAGLSEIKTSSLCCLLSESFTGVTRKGNVAAEGGGAGEGWGVGSGGGGGHILSVGAIADWKRECLSKAVIPFSMILKIRDLPGPYMVRLGVSS